MTTTILPLKRKPTYGDKRDYYKIDLYTRNRVGSGFSYETSTTWAATLIEARRIYAQHNLPISNVQAIYAESAS